MQKLFYVLSITLLFFSSGALCQSGYLDSTFGMDGIVTTDIGTSSTDLLFAVAIQPDQKILAAGTSGGDFVVVRYLQDGSIDTDFGMEGIVKVDFGQTSDFCHDMTIQPDGFILLAGESSKNNLTDFALVRLDTNGSLDMSFGMGGKVITDLGGSYEYANAIAVQPDGKIIAAGKSTDGSVTNANFAMIRYEVNGEIDTDFGVNGIAITSIRDEDEAQGIIIMPDGKIVLGGFAAVNAKGDFALAGYLADGTEDKSFGTGGKVVTDLAGAGVSDYATSLLLDKNGKIVVAGAANYNTFEGSSDLGLVRYTAQGALDAGFANGGIDIIDVGGNSQIAALIQQPDGKYLLAGQSDGIGFVNQWMLARIKNNGTLDSLFGDNGITVTNMVGDINESASCIVLQQDSRIVVGGLPGTNTNLDFTLARYIADFMISVTVESGVTCSGISDAVISVSVSGGVPPYQYSLNGVNFQSSPVFNIGSGDFTVTIRDSNGAGTLGSYGPFHIDDAPPPPPVQVDIVSNSITITVDGSGTYSYSIDGGSTFQPENSFTGLPDGVYQIYVIDEVGCIIFSGEAVVQGTAVKNLQGIQFSLAPNPCRDFLSVEIARPSSSLNAFIFDLNGRLVLHEDVNPKENGIVQLDVNRLSNGQYTLWIRDGEKWGVASFIKQ